MEVQLCGLVFDKIELRLLPLNGKKLWASSTSKICGLRQPDMSMRASEDNHLSWFSILSEEEELVQRGVQLCEIDPRLGLRTFIG
jgi:hypothetical protein